MWNDVLGAYNFSRRYSIFTHHGILKYLRVHSRTILSVKMVCSSGSELLVWNHVKSTEITSPGSIFFSMKNCFIFISIKKSSINYKFLIDFSLYFFQFSMLESKDLRRFNRLSSQLFDIGIQKYSQKEIFRNIQIYCQFVFLSPRWYSRIVSNVWDVLWYKMFPKFEFFRFFKKL